jgi:glucokinase
MLRILAADFGGTRLRAAVVDETGAVSGRREVESPDQREGVLPIVLSLLEATVEEAGGHVDACCIASAGMIDAVRGRVIISPNIPGFRGLELTGPVAERLGIPAYIENDASAAALGEFRFGAGREYRHFAHLTLGTGIGGGLVLDGRLYRGARGFAGEFGHMTIDPTGPDCSCGSRGCVEAFASGTAFARRAKRLVESGRSRILAEVVGADEPSGEHLLAAAQNGDALSEAEIRNGGHCLGLGVGSLINLLNPEAITLSGGLLAMGDLYLEPMKKAIAATAFGPTTGVAIRLSELGDDAGLLGAAAVALEYLGRE